MTVAGSLILKPYKGRDLTEQEILLVQHIEQERQKLRMTEQEKLEQKKFLATKVMEGNNKAAMKPRAEVSEPAPQVKRPTPAPAREIDHENESKAQPTHAFAKVEHRPEHKFEDVDYSIEKETGIVSTVIGRKRQLEEENEDDIPVNEYFCASGIVLDRPWDSVADGMNKIVNLPNFTLENINTIGIKLSSQQTRGWAFNICPAHDQYLVDILFHFNPRYKTKSGKPEIIMNDRIGTWGDGAKEEMRNPRGILSNPIDLKVEIRNEGFLIFANGIYAAFFPHRRDIKQFKDLKIVFIAKDDNGNPEEVKINSVWWGHLDFKRETLSPAILGLMQKAMKTTFDSVSNPMGPRTIVAEGLPKLEDLELLQGLEYSLIDMFEPYGCKRVSLVTGAGIGYIKVSSPTAY